MVQVTEKNTLLKVNDFDSPTEVVGTMDNRGSSGESGFEMHANVVKWEVENYLDSQMIVFPKTNLLQWW